MVLILAADQISKIVIAANPSKYADLEIIPGFFYISYVKNTGAAWSMMSGQRILLCLIAIAAIAGMTVFLLKAKRENNRLTVYALTLMIAGAAGNLIDRLYLGYVRDFLHFYPLGYDFPVFNIADVSLCIGVGLLIFSTMIEDDEVKKKTDPDAPLRAIPEKELQEKMIVMEPEVIEPKKDRTGVD